MCNVYLVGLLSAYQAVNRAQPESSKTSAQIKLVLCEHCRRRWDRICKSSVNWSLLDNVRRQSDRPSLNRKFKSGKWEVGRNVESDEEIKTSESSEQGLANKCQQ